MPEITLDRLAQMSELQVLTLHGDGARFDLRQIQNITDQIQQIRAGAVDRVRKLDLSRAQVAICVFRKLFSGVRSSCDMFARNSDLYRDVSASSAAFSSSARRASSIS